MAGEDKTSTRLACTTYHWEIILLLFSLYGVLASAFDAYSSSGLYAFALLAGGVSAVWATGGEGRALTQGERFSQYRVWSLIGVALIGIQAYLVSAAAESPWFNSLSFFACVITFFGAAAGIFESCRSGNALLFGAMEIPQDLACSSIALGVCLSDSSFPYASWLGGQGYWVSMALCLVTAVIATVARKDGADASAQPSGKQEERVLSYLRGRGLNELQARVVLLTAEGKSRADICERLAIAGGTVNSYRATGYRLLDVHSADQLRELLQKEAGLSLS